MGILELTPSVIHGLCQFSRGDRLFGESSGHEAGLRCRDTAICDTLTGAG